VRIYVFLVVFLERILAEMTLIIAFYAGQLMA